jgi:predicted RNase H-like HicB family nuclease
MTPMDKKVRRILKKPYSRVLVPQPEHGGYSAEILEFPGCFAEGPTVALAYVRLEGTAESWLLSCLEQKIPIPKPFLDYNKERRVSCGVPFSVYRALSKAAIRERVSMSQYLSKLLMLLSLKTSLTDLPCCKGHKRSK